MKRVFMFSGCRMFGKGIESLLGGVANVEVVGRETNPDRAIERIRQLRPDVVIVDDTGPSPESEQLVMRFLRVVPGVKVIGLNLQTNAMSIYRGQERMGLEVEDLVQVIEEDDWHDQIDFAGYAGVAVARSSLYGYLATLFRRLGSEGFTDTIDGENLYAALGPLADTEGQSEDVAAGFDLMAIYSQQSVGKPVDELRAELAGESKRLLQGKGAEPCLPLPREANYSNLDQSGRERNVAALLRAYVEAGAGLSEGMKESSDLISVELDFMRHLTEEEAQAWSDCRPMEAQAVLEKEQAFLDDHLALWVPRLCDAILEQARLDLFRGIARMTKGFVLDEAKEVGQVLPRVRAGVGQSRTLPGRVPAKERSGE